MKVNKNVYDPKISIDYPFFKDDINNLRSFNAMSIATTIFNFEKKMGRDMIKEVYLRILETGLKGDINDDLIDLISFTFFEYVKFKLKPTEFPFKEPKKDKPKEEYDAVCLFSGGIDSYSGILNSKKHFNNLQGVFIAHTDQKKIIKIVKDLSEEVLEQKGIDLFKLNAPSMGKGGYSQTRGFLYMLSAAGHMNLVGADKLIVSECGPTMYQPQFGPADSVTLTSNPVVIDITKKIIPKILKKNIKIITPFEDLTKAEVMAISPLKGNLELTHSCITQRFGDHCGVCYGCVVRRLGGIAAGIKDASYRKNPILDKNANSENLHSLLIFSQDILLDFEGMEYYQRKNIDAYQKEDLFTRFALDNFAAIHRLIKDNKDVTKVVRILYSETVKEIGAKKLDERIEALENGNFTPNYSEF